MRRHKETHRTEHVGWLRATVLGANDGIVSTASLIIGVAAAHGSRSAVLVAGLAGLVAGAMSMAAGEYVSVSSQSDTERADIERERRELAEDPAAEHTEMVKIYLDRGLDRALAEQVATQLMGRDALGAHAREELGITEELRARPLQAALASAASFAVGAAVPLVTGVVSPMVHIVPIVAVTCLVLLALLGGLAARVGGARPLIGAARVTLWSALAMAVTAAAGALFGAAG
ncbi:MAG TPA: VIT family protein [Gemmatimonadales bacterium]|nr:VIT family protein [Gemmatimonadales bacterium]